MNIQGLQKLTLLDYPGKVACTIFTSGCNFRCPFCHNAPLVLGTGQTEKYSEKEIFTFLKKRQGILDGVCASGGEPLLQNDIERFLEQVKELGFLVKLDTNGSFPKKLKSLVQNGLADYVAMDIKNSKRQYCKTAGIEESRELMERIQESVAFLLGHPVAYEFRTTVIQEYHTRESFEEIGRWIRGAEKYFLQSFVDSGELIGDEINGCEKAEMQAFAEVIRPYVSNVELRGV